jgi:hypothetical protein
MKRIRAAKIFFVAWIVLLLVLIIFQAHILKTQGTRVIRQKILFEALTAFEAAKETVPPVLTDLTTQSTSQSSKHDLSAIISEEKKHGLTYNHKSWQKPGDIFLKTDVGDKSVVTFGDGSFAVVNSLYKKTGESYESVIKTHLSQTMLLLLIGSVIALVITIVIEKLFA